MDNYTTASEDIYGHGQDHLVAITVLCQHHNCLLSTSYQDSVHIRKKLLE